MILHANCKINLGLDVLRRREDGYHELSTVMFPVRGLYDVVGVTRTAVPGVRFLSEGLAVDCAPGENICVKAFQLMRERYGVDGVEIRLDKRVPFGAGLGGGSSDGTAVLLALDGLFGLRLAEAELVALAAELGSDTAFFVRNTPQLCTGSSVVMTTNTSKNHRCDINSQANVLYLSYNDSPGQLSAFPLTYCSIINCGNVSRGMAVNIGIPTRSTRTFHHFFKG